MKAQTFPNQIKRYRGFSKFILNLIASMVHRIPLPIIKKIYSLKPIAKIIRFGLNLIAPEGYVQVSVAAGELVGTRMILDLKLEKDYWLGTYEPELIAAIADMVEPGMVAYDLGANIGYVTLLLGKRVGSAGQVYAFEALPENIERLRANISLNDMEETVSVQALAVASHSGSAKFLIGPSIGMGKLDGSVGRDKVVYSDSLSVESVTLDDFVYLRGNQEPDVVKMDIEGGEILALLGMERILDKGRPLVFLELHGFDAAQAAWELFIQADYQFLQMEPELLPIKSFKELDWKAYLIAKPV